MNIDIGQKIDIIFNLTRLYDEHLKEMYCDNKNLISKVLFILCYRIVCLFILILNSQYLIASRFYCFIYLFEFKHR